MMAIWYHNTRQKPSGMSRALLDVVEYLNTRKCQLCQLDWDHLVVYVPAQPEPLQASSS
jgi:hypothetical protein